MGLFSKDKNQQIILDEKDFRKFVGALKEHGQLVKLIGPGFAAGSVTALWNKWSGGRPTFQFSTSDKSQWKDIFGGLLTYEMLMVRQGHDHISALQLRARTGGFADEFTDKIMPSADYNARDTDSNEDRATAYIVHTSNSLKTSADVPNAPITRTGVKDALRNAAMYDVRSETVLRDLHRRSVNQASLKPTRSVHRRVRRRPRRRDRAQRVPEQRIRRHALRAVLRAEAEQDHVSLPLPHVDQRRLAGQLVAAEQPAGEQRVALRRIARDHRRARRVGDLERGAALEPGHRLRRGHAGRQRVRLVELHAEDRARRVELRRAQPGERVLHRQVQRLDGVLAGVVERDQRAARLDERLERRRALLADAALERVGIRALRPARDLPRRLLGEDDGVEARAGCRRAAPAR
jgi:hypothetical protein